MDAMADPGLSLALGALAAALARRADAAPTADRRDRAELLRRHVAEYLLPRAHDLSAPLVVVLLGSTGSGKSSLFNALAGRQVSQSGVLRPTTRRPVVLVHPANAEVLEQRYLLPGLLERGQLEVVKDTTARPGLLVVDAPDFDSVELENRALAVELLEAADLVVFVTTADRYADQVPWTVLARARQRGVPLLTLLNRLPPDDADAAAVVDDYRRLLERGELTDAGAFGRLEVVPVREGELDRARDALSRDAVAPLLRALDRLMTDAAARRAVAARSLAQALAGLPNAVEEVAREVDAERAAAEQLLDAARASYADRRRALGEELGRGTFLRAEVLRQWQDFVGAGQLARFLATGIGRVAAAIRALIQPGPPPPDTEVREAAFADLVALATHHLDAAARRAASAWSEDRYGAAALAERPELWSSSADLAARLTAELERWAAWIGARIQEVGEQRRGWARVASIGVNVLGTGVILAVFTHTGGLTGAEVGITAATAFINQKLLEAIFGEATLQAFVSGAREQLTTVLNATFAAEETRFADALGLLAADRDLARGLREAAGRAAGLAASAA
jgi:energy-coupling factor transporter ATP-binding protein EcfA2